MSGVLTVLTGAGSAYAAYDALNQDLPCQQMVLGSIAGGVVLSLLLQGLAGKFSAEQKPLPVRVIRVLLGDATSFVTHVVLPCSVVYGYAKKKAEILNNYSFGLFRIDPQIVINGYHLTQFYPIFAGANLGFFAGQKIGDLISHFVRA